MDIKEIQELLRFINKSDLTEVKIEQGDFKITIRRENPEQNIVYTSPTVLPAPQPQVIAAPAPIALPSEPAPKAEEAKVSESANLYSYRCPMIGTFYRAATPNDPPFVKVGDTVSKGQKLCIVEAMKLFNEIESEVSGKIVKILVENAQPVEYNQVLFLIDTTA